MHKKEFDELSVAIVRQACKDYYKTCIPKTYNRPKHKKTGEPYSDSEYEEYCSQKEMKRKRRKAECEIFFKSEWCRALSKADGKSLMKFVYDKRERGLPLFEKEEEEEDEKEIEEENLDDLEEIK